MDVQNQIRQILEINPERATETDRKRLDLVWKQVRTGAIRAAERTNGSWQVNTLLKEVIIWAFRAGILVDYPADRGGVFSFTDKNTLPVQQFNASSGRRIVPGGTVIRDGSYVAPGVIVMPPSYINIGAYIDSGTLVDSHVLIGSCAQIGSNVHLSAGVQIGGVLEPIGAVPVIVEDDVMVGGNCGIYEGTVVRRGAVLGTGVILNKSTPVFDIVREVIYRKTTEHSLEIPENAVVVQGSRPANGSFAVSHNINLYTPVIVKYRDDKTDAATALEEALR